MSVRTRFEQLFRYNGIDPLVDDLLAKWENSLNSTVARLTPVKERCAEKNLAALEKALGEYSDLIGHGLCSRIKNYLQRVTNDLTERFLNYNVPVIISKSIATFIRIPCDNDVHFLINAGSEMPFCQTYNYYSLPHEIGHLLFQVQLEDQNLEFVTEKYTGLIRDRVEELGLNCGINDAWLIDLKFRWVNELVADTFALDMLGPAYAYFWTQAHLRFTNKRLGDEEYPPENLRTNWMVRRLNPGRLRNKCEFAGKSYKSNLVPTIRNARRKRNYDMRPGFWSRHNISKGQRSKWRKLFFEEDMYDIVTETSDTIQKNGKVEFSPEKVSIAIESLNANQKPTTDSVSSFAALLETCATFLTKGRIPNLETPNLNDLVMP